MKKSIIAAGAASAVLAAMPVVGVFAADVTTQTDKLQITIDKVCLFGHKDTDASIDVAGVAHANGDGAWGTEDTADTLSKTMSTGTTTNNLGTTTLGVYCNNENGYKITTTNAAALTGVVSSTDSTAITDTIDINASFSTSASGWSYKVAAGNGANQRGEVVNSHDSWATSANANGIIAQSPSAAPKTTSNDGDFFTITYGVGIDNTQSAGLYTGSITYTLAQL